MITVGLILSAGGFQGAAHHSGVLDALSETTGWDARTPDVILGTSAGALIAVSLRSGLTSSDLAAQYTGKPLSTEGKAVIDRIKTPSQSSESGLALKNRNPSKPSLVIRELLLGGRPRPMVAAAGLLPEGEIDGSFFAKRVQEMHPEPWPEKPTWLCAVDIDSGKRVVFGRDDIKASLGDAVQASSAVPGRFTIVEIDGKRYIDGGVHSLSNADLLAPLQLDLVIVSSSTTVISSSEKKSVSLLWNSRTLRKEIEQIRSTGTEVLLLEPTASDLANRSNTKPTKETTKEIFKRSRTSAIARLAKPESIKSRELLIKTNLQT